MLACVCRACLRNPSISSAYDLRLRDTLSATGAVQSVSNFFVSYANGSALANGTDYNLTVIGSSGFEFQLKRALTPAKDMYQAPQSVFITFDAKYVMTGPSCSFSNKVEITGYTEAPNATLNLAPLRNVSATATGSTSPITVTPLVSVPANDTLIKGKPFSVDTCYSFTGVIVAPVFTITAPASAQATIVTVVVPEPGTGGSLVGRNASGSVVPVSSLFTAALVGGNLVLTSAANSSIFSNGDGTSASQLCFRATYLSKEPLSLTSDLTYANSGCQDVPAQNFSISPVQYDMTTSISGPGSCSELNKTYTLTIDSPGSVPGSPSQPV